MCKLKILPTFSSDFGLYQLLREISGSLAAKCFTIFSSESLTFHVCCMVLVAQSMFLEVLSLKQLPAMATNDTDERD